MSRYKERSYYNLNLVNGHNGFINDAVNYTVLNGYLTIYVNNNPVKCVRIYTFDKIHLCVTETDNDVNVDLVYVSA